MFRVLKDCAQETPREVSLEGFCVHNHGSWTWTVRVFCVIWPFLRPVPWGGGSEFQGQSHTVLCDGQFGFDTHVFYLVMSCIP